MKWALHRREYWITNHHASVLLSMNFFCFSLLETYKIALNLCHSNDMHNRHTPYCHMYVKFRKTLSFSFCQQRSGHSVDHQRWWPIKWRHWWVTVKRVYTTLLLLRKQVNLWWYKTRTSIYFRDWHFKDFHDTIQYWYFLNPFNAEATFIKGTITQILFLKTFEILSCWNSLESSCWILSDEYPFARASVIFQLFRILFYQPN